MAVQINIYKPMGSLEVIPDTTYDHTNITSAANVVRLSVGSRITDKDGNNTPIRGVRMVITNNEVAATNPVPNVPFIWYEGDFLYFDPDYTYKFIDYGIVAYGMEITV